MPTSDAMPFSTALSIRITATNNSLARVIVLLHRRGAHVRHLKWDAPGLCGDGHASMTVIAQFQHDRVRNLQTSLAQLVNVFDVQDIEATLSHSWTKSGSTWW